MRVREAIGEPIEGHLDALLHPRLDRPRHLPRSAIAIERPLRLRARAYEQRGLRRAAKRDADRRARARADLDGLCLPFAHERGVEMNDHTPGLEDAREPVADRPARADEARIGRRRRVEHVRLASAPEDERVLEELA